jgi:hypothetical protein
MKKVSHLWKKRVKKANIAAAVLIILLVVLSIGVLIYNPFVPEEVHVDYGDVFTEVRAGVERSYFDSFQTSLRTGLLMYDGVWYYNQPYGIDTVKVEDILRELVEQSVLSVEYDGGVVEINLSDVEGNVSVSLEEGGFRILLSGASVEIMANNEKRIIELDDEFFIPSDLKRTIDSLNTWLACDAGGLTDLFREFYRSEPCQFSNCCCGRELISMDEINRVVEKHGITRQNITKILDESVDVLNHLLSGASACGQEADTLRNNYKCFVSYDRSVIEFDTEYRLGIFPDKLCAEKPGTTSEEMTDCDFNPSPTVDQELYEWVTTNQVIFDIEDLDFDDLLLKSNLSPAPPTENLSIPPPDVDNDPAALYELALEKSAAGDITIICRNPDLSISDYQELRFRIKFKNRYVCELPDDEPDWDNEPDLIPVADCAGGGGGGPAACPEHTPFGVPCAPDDRIQDAHCPIDFICVEENIPELYRTDGLFLCGEYVDRDLEWFYPGFDDRCEGEFHTCSLCGDQARCDEPVVAGTGCSTIDNPTGRIGCVVLQCDGTTVGQDACVLEVANDARCGSGVCRGTCNPDTGDCDYSGVNQNSCVRRVGSCSIAGTCNNGRCIAPDPGTACCDGEFCPSNQPYCCGGSYCSSDPTCPVPS